MKQRAYFFTYIFLTIFILSLVTQWYSTLVLLLVVTILIFVLDKVGKGIVLRELIALHASFVCLVMPLVGYTFYTRDNPLALLWGRYMKVPEEMYFSFALPAMAGFTLILCWPLMGEKASDMGNFLDKTIDRAKEILKNNHKAGIYIMIVGLLVFAISDYLPIALQFAFLMFYFSSFAGLLYIYFNQNYKYRIPVLITFVVFIILNALRGGMFTIVAYMGITLFSFFFVKKKTYLLKKIMFFLLGAVVLLVIQSVKQNYRKITWKEGYSGNRAAVFADLVADKLSSSENFATVNSLFPIYYRTNQGYNISLVMRRFPRVVPYDGGSALLKSLAASLVPRILWPDKPEAGGKFNMQYYTGYIINGWSTNVGPLGEAYGSFGPTGGVFYMLVLAFFIRWSYSMVFLISRKVPLIIFWIPVLFYQVTYSAESDTLQILNSLVKATIFVWILYKAIPGWFMLVKKRIRQFIPRYNGMLAEDSAVS